MICNIKAIRELAENTNLSLNSAMTAFSMILTAEPADRITLFREYLLWEFAHNPAVTGNTPCILVKNLERNFSPRDRRTCCDALSEIAVRMEAFMGNDGEYSQRLWQEFTENSELTGSLRPLLFGLYMTSKSQILRIYADDLKAIKASDAEEVEGSEVFESPEPHPDDGISASEVGPLRVNSEEGSPVPEAGLSGLTSEGGYPAQGPDAARPDSLPGLIDTSDIPQEVIVDAYGRYNTAYPYQTVYQIIPFGREPDIHRFVLSARELLPDMPIRKIEEPDFGISFFSTFSGEVDALLAEGEKYGISFMLRFENYIGKNYLKSIFRLCPKCGRYNKRSADFCTWCGAPAEGKKSVFLYEAIDPRELYSYCSCCGKLIRNSFNYCPGCGARIDYKSWDKEGEPFRITPHYDFPYEKLLRKKISGQAEKLSSRLEKTIRDCMDRDDDDGILECLSPLHLRRDRTGAEAIMDLITTFDAMEELYQVLLTDFYDFLSRREYFDYTEKYRASVSAALEKLFFQTDSEELF